MAKENKMTKCFSKKQSNLIFILLLLILFLSFAGGLSLLRFNECREALGDSPICYKYAIKGDL